MVNSGIDITQEKAIEEAEDKKNEELKRLNDLMVGREIKMMELKKEISKLIINEK